MKSISSKFLFLSLYLLVLSSINAQVTITADDFPRAATFQDSFYVSTVINPVLPAEGPNQSWDYSNLEVADFIENPYTDASSDPNFLAAFNRHVADRTFQGFHIDSEEYEGLDEEGWYVLGRTTEDVVYSIALLTGGPNDSLRFAQSAVDYPGRINNIQFPLNYEDQWSQSHVEIQPYALTVAAFGLNNTPGTFERIIMEDREIVGWGTLTLAGLDGQPTAPIDALQLKVISTSTDSVFLGGAPAPGALMAAFGLTQGASTIDSFYVFYAPGFGAPVFSLEYGDEFAVWRPQAAATISSTRTLELTPSQVFPNPVKAGASINLQLQDPIAQAQILLSDMNGRLLLQQNIGNVNEQGVQISIPGSLPQGVYTYQVKNESGYIRALGRVIVE